MGAPPVRLVATDLDGTLLRPDGTVSARTRAALDAVWERGTRVVLVTARPPRWVDELAAALSCDEIVICANGAILYDARTRRVLRHDAIGAELGTELVQRLRDELPELTFAIERESSFGHEPDYRCTWERPEDTLVAPAEELVAAGCTKLLCQSAPPIDHEVLVKRCQAAAGDLGAVTISSLDGLVEIAAPGVSKGAALARRCRELDIEASEVVAFGDMLNDLSLLAFAGWGVAVDNAHAELKVVADEVTASCGEDGVARVLERIFSLC